MQVADTELDIINLLHWKMRT